MNALVRGGWAGTWCGAWRHQQPDLPGLGGRLAEVTATPRKYGFHATLKPPFRLAEGMTVEALDDALQAFAASQAVVTVDRLAVSRIGHFLALTPQGDTGGLQGMAARCVTEFDRFRAPLTPADMERRRAAGLSPRQEVLLAEWGYPYVLDEFRFHMTLSGRLSDEDLALVQSVAESAVPSLPEPYAFEGVALVGERPDGMFQLVHRYTFTG